MRPSTILASEMTKEHRYPPSKHHLPIVYECWSQSLSFAKARNRCERPFFFTFSISAYVSPMYSKMGSQPSASVR